MLYEQIVENYPELTSKDFGIDGLISLVDDGDGVQYISKWEYTEPIPAGLKLGK